MTKTCCVVPDQPGGKNDDCDGKVQSIVLEYTGKGCAATNNPQDGKAMCSGGADMAQPVDILVTDNRGDILYADSMDVEIGDTVLAIANFAGDDDDDIGEFKAETRVTISDPDTGEVLEEIKFHTSCSKTLGVGDEFGSVRVIELTTTHGGTVTLPGTGSDNESACVVPDPPQGDHCDGKVVEMVLEYTGEPCSATTNTQEGRFECDEAAPLNGEQPIEIVITRDGSTVSVNPSLNISLGDPVTFTATGNELKADTHFDIRRAVTSCSLSRSTLRVPDRSRWAISSAACS